MKKETKAQAAVDPASGATEPPKFEEAMDRLEGLVRELEDGELPLEETIARFEEGQKLLRTLTELLDRAELKVKTVLRQAGGGEGALSEADWEAGEGDDATS